MTLYTQQMTCQQRLVADGLHKSLKLRELNEEMGMRQRVRAQHASNGMSRGGPRVGKPMLTR